MRNPSVNRSSIAFVMPIPPGTADSGSPSSRNTLMDNRYFGAGASRPGFHPRMRDSVWLYDPITEDFRQVPGIPPGQAWDIRFRETRAFPRHSLGAAGVALRLAFPEGGGCVLSRWVG